MTKLVTALCAMQLVEKGAIGLDDDLGSLIPELAHPQILQGFDDDDKPILKTATKSVTLRSVRTSFSFPSCPMLINVTCRKLLTHSSGCTYDVFQPELIKWSAVTNRTGSSMETGTRAALDFPFMFEPGEGWVYGVGIDWTGLVIEALSGSTLEDYMRQHIFEPLGMSSSTFYVTKHPELTDRLAALSFRASPTDRPVLGENPWNKDPEIASGGAGLHTTAADYAAFLGAVVDRSSKLLAPESFDELFRPQLEDPSHFQEFCDGESHEAICADFPIGLPVNYGLGGAVNLQDLPGRRKKGSMMWSGMTNPRWVRNLSFPLTLSDRC
jgi:CubicO group peptidase (beta-lactamase class C family)